MSTARTGREREWRVVRLLETYGWRLVMRSAGSKGAADLAMAHEQHGLALIQVGTQNKSLGPDDRERLCDLADLCSALPILARVVPRQGIEFTHVARTRTAWERWMP